MSECLSTNSGICIMHLPKEIAKLKTQLAKLEAENESVHASWERSEAELSKAQATIKDLKAKGRELLYGAIDSPYNPRRYQEAFADETESEPTKQERGES